MSPDSATTVAELQEDQGNGTIESFASNTLLRYNSSKFYGIIVDTRATQRSTAGIHQFTAFQRLSPDVVLDKLTKSKVVVRFGIGLTSSIGSVTIDTPIGQVEFHILPVTTSFLLSLRDIDRLQVYFNNLTNSLVTLQSSMPVVRRFGHSFLL